MTRMTLSLIALATLVGSCPTLRAAPDFAAEMEAVERARFQTWVNSDVAGMQAVMADDALYCHSSGVCQSKKEFIADIQAKKIAYKKLDLLSMTPKALGKDAALINGTVDLVAASPGNEVKFKGIYTAVYVKRHGHWQLLSWQSTTVR